MNKECSSVFICQRDKSAILRVDLLFLTLLGVVFAGQRAMMGRAQAREIE
jgi:hypothetical protein